jgi:enoyl-CoA hydratase/carnithine racemase
MDPNHVSVATTGGVARVTLNRPERRNALSLDLLEALQGVLVRIGTDPGVQVVVISGAGPVFSAGHDMGEMLDRSAEFYDRLFSTCTDVMLTLQRLPQPVIAQVHGVATAAGCQLVAACDLAVAGGNSRFATPGVHIGLFCSTPMVPLSRAIGRKRAMQMLLTGDFVDAATALEWGLVNQVVPDDELERATDRLASRIMQFSKVVIAIGKRAFYAQVDVDEAAAYEIVGPMMRDNAQHVDAQEGMRAFLEKRTPEWPSQQVGDTGRLQS